MKTIFVFLFLIAVSAHAEETSYYKGPATLIGGKSKSFMVMTKVSHLATGVSHSIYRFSPKDKTGTTMSVTLKKSGSGWIIHTDTKTLPDSDFTATVTGPAQKPSLIVARAKSVTDSKMTVLMKMVQSEKNLDTEIITTNSLGKIQNKVTTSQTMITKEEFEKVKSSLKLK